MFIFDNDIYSFALIFNPICYITGKFIHLQKISFITVKIILLFFTISKGRGCELPRTKSIRDKWNFYKFV